MAKEVERLPRPEPEPPVNNPTPGKIRVIVTGGLKVTSDNQQVEIERKD